MDNTYIKYNKEEENMEENRLKIDNNNFFTKI